MCAVEPCRASKSGTRAPFQPSSTSTLSTNAAATMSLRPSLYRSVISGVAYTAELVRACHLMEMSSPQVSVSSALTSSGTLSRVIYCKDSRAEPRVCAAGGFGKF